MRFLCLFLLLVGAISLSGQSTLTELEKLENRWITALRQNDTLFLRDFYHPQLIYTHSNGKVENKEQWLANFRSGGLRYQEVVPVALRIQVFGKMALISYAADFDVLNQGNPLRFKAQVLHVYTQERGKWQLVAHQTTRLP